MFVAAIELLEAYDYHISTFSPMNWGWVFEITVPWLAIAIVLTYTPKLTRQPDIDRAQKQIEIAFRRYETPERSIGTSPLWQLLVDLRLKVDASWSREHQGRNCISPNIQLTEANRAGAAFSSDPNLRFTDDLMLDLANFAPQSDRVMYDDSLFMQDASELPW